MGLNLFKCHAAQETHRLTPFQIWEGSWEYLMKDHRFPIVFNTYFQQTVLTWINLQCSKNYLYWEYRGASTSIQVNYKSYVFVQGELENRERFLKIEETFGI